MFRLRPSLYRNIRSKRTSTLAKQQYSTEKQNGQSLSRQLSMISRQTHTRPSSYSHSVSFLQSRTSDGIYNINPQPAVQYQSLRFTSNNEHLGPDSALHKPTNFEKRILVLNKRYPSKEEVPERVSNSEIVKAKDWFRIRVNLGMILATVIGALVFAISGKRAAARGESVSRQSINNTARLRQEGLDSLAKK